jgi:hypothetical protein
VKNLHMETLKMRKDVGVRKLVIGKMLGLMHNTDDLKFETLSQMENARRQLDLLRLDFRVPEEGLVVSEAKAKEIFNKFNMPTFGTPFRPDADGIYPEKTAAGERFPADPNSLSPIRKKVKNFWGKLNVAYNNRSEYNSNFHQIRPINEALYPARMKFRKVFATVDPIAQIYENRISNIRDILTQKIYPDPKIFQPPTSSPIPKSISSINFSDHCNDCGGITGDYLKRLGKGADADADSN